MGRFLVGSSEKKDETAVPAGANANAPDTPPPHSWKSIVIASCGVVMAVALGAVLLAGFLHTRPVDLRDHSRALARELDRLLAYNQIPQANISLGVEEERRDASARWIYYGYEVNLPETLSLSGVEGLIRKNMAGQNVVVFDEPGLPAGKVSLSLVTAGYEFAHVTLIGKPGQTNLTEATSRLAQEVFALLSALNPPMEALERTPAEPRENDDAIWEFTAMSARLARPGGASELVERIAGAMGQREVHVKVEAGSTDAETILTISYHGLDCVRLTLRTSPEPAPTPETATVLPNGPSDYDSEVSKNGEGSETLPLDSEHLNGDAREPAKHRKQTSTPQAAIIVDDGGYGAAVTEEILALDPALTLSILPHAPHSAETARRAEELGFEVMLHMPMENSSERTAYPGQIATGMTPEEIHRLTDEAVADVPGAVGMNNHTGSKFTSDPEAMRVFFDDIKPRGLFFIDSRTISTSKAFNLAREMGVASAARDLFLDHEGDKNYVRGQFRQLIDLCKTHGSAIGICHFRRTSVDVLREMIPEFAKEGVMIVHASELTE